MGASSATPLITPDSQRYSAAPNGQLTLEFEAGLVDRYASVREVVAAGIYQRGLTRVAEKLFVPPGNLSVQLSDKGERKFDVDDLELYVETFGDKTPILYLAAKYLDEGNKASDSQKFAAQLRDLLAQVEGRK